MASLFSRNARMTRTKFGLFVIGTSVAVVLLEDSVTARLGWVGRFDILTLAPRSWLELACALLLIPLAIARLHDMGRSGWWVLTLPALTLISVFAGPSTALGGALITLVLIAVLLAYWLALLFWPGTIGPNRFGPDPRGWESRAQFDAQKQRLSEEADSYKVRR